MRANSSTLAVLVVAVVVSLTFAMPAAAGTPAVSANGGTVAPGETVTVTVDVENAQTAKLGSIPGSWMVESVESAGASTIERDTYVGWAWGADQTSQTVSVTLGVPADTDPGEYALEVTVEDSDGNKARSTAMATVETTDTTPPVADAGEDLAVDTGETTTFDGTDSTDNTAIASYEWAFGDGTTASGSAPTHTYGTPGAYEVTLTVTDEAGNEATDTLTVTVESTTTEPTTTTVGDETTTATVDDETTETDESMDGNDEPTTTRPVETETTAGSGNGDGFTLVAAIVSVAATVIVVRRRRL